MPPTISYKDAEPVGSLAATSMRKTRRDERQTDLVLNPVGNVSNEVVKYGDARSCDGGTLRVTIMAQEEARGASPHLRSAASFVID